ncbi:MAG: hypothetical protein KGM98_11215, partial [Bacteroidota bacterium]|nr:hypothetical protein [Bacteroidota bacterium]
PKIWQEFYFQRQFHATQIIPLLENVKLRIVETKRAIIPPLNTVGICSHTTLHHFFHPKKEPAIPPR